MFLTDRFVIHILIHWTQDLAKKFKTLLWEGAGKGWDWFIFHTLQLQQRTGTLSKNNCTFSSIEMKLRPLYTYFYRQKFL